MPVTVAGGSLRAGRVRLDAGESSQYLSALLMAGLAAPGPIAVEVDRLTSAPYVELTREAIAAFGGRVERRREEGREAWRIEPGLTPPSEIEVEADYSAAAYPAAAAALSGGRVELAGLRPDSAQGDRRFLELLGEMGAEVEAGADGWRVAAAGELSAVDVDLSTMPDQVPTLAALAPFARGITRIRGAAHLRIKESDRLAAMARELGRLGVPVRERPDGLEIEGAWARRPPPDAPTRVDTWDDHRIAMSLALVGLRRPGVVIRRPAVVAKSYPGFWTDLARLLGPS